MYKLSADFESDIKKFFNSENSLLFLQFIDKDISKMQLIMQIIQNLVTDNLGNPKYTQKSIAIIVHLGGKKAKHSKNDIKRMILNTISLTKE